VSEAEDLARLTPETVDRIVQLLQLAEAPARKFRVAACEKQREKAAEDDATDKQ
jgi:hypothetical protein